ncbi:MAG: hypothetical protein HYW03_05490 [Deltaproteobacteria bacterium]|nr:hypothetical protein [Deltaproteobacteria bacterium]
MSKAVPFLFFLVLSGAELRAQVPYYQGKTITFIVRSGAGTAYDMYGRLPYFTRYP